MTPVPDQLAALVASRVCHDLINPIGAIGNGLELIALESGQLSPEQELLQQSATRAQAQVQYFRIAYGHPGDGETQSRSEIARIISENYAGTKIETVCDLDDDVLRADARLALLLVQCLETAIPHGGRIRLRRTGRTWHAEASATRWRRDVETLWPLLDPQAGAGGIDAAKVHFPLAAIAADALGRTITVSRTEERVELTA